MPKRFGSIVGMLLVTTSAHPLYSQTRQDELAPCYLTEFSLLGSVERDELRLRQITGESSTDGALIESPALGLDPLVGSGPRWCPIQPTVRSLWNSQLPFSLNEGSLWGGRGFNAVATGGIRFVSGSLDIVLAPQVSYSQNVGFQTIAPRVASRSQYSSPFHFGAYSADLPIRFGDAPLAVIHPGQSSITYRAAGFQAGLSTENEWWGPGIRNAIVMSSNAEGFPRAFIGTDEAFHIPGGWVEGRAIAGALTESMHFDTESYNDLRTISGVVGTFRPDFEPDLTLGIARTVYGRTEGRRDVVLHALDAVTWWKQQVEPPDPGIADTLALEAQLSAQPKPLDREQLTSLFARWIFPDDGLELYGEFARVTLPGSIRELLLEPHHNLGYTLGVQWARRLGDGAFYRLQGETTFLEQSSSYNNRPGLGFYVSQSVTQGYTQRGRSVGAAIGPGGSSQWLAVDRLGESWSAGVFAGRIRWDNDVYYLDLDRQEVGHDVSVFSGFRGGGEWRGVQAHVDITLATRLNYLFQNPGVEPEGRHAVDVNNSSIGLTLKYAP